MQPASSPPPQLDHNRHLQHQDQNPSTNPNPRPNQGREPAEGTGGAQADEPAQQSSGAGSLGGSLASSLTGLQGAGAGLQANRLGRLVGKKASRVRELLLQNLGRAERTTDELFNLYEENFFKQHHQAARIAKEFKSHLNSLRSFQESSRSLNQLIKQCACDHQAARHDLVCDNLSQLEQLNEELLAKLRERILQNLDSYLGQFDELKQKISKRHRKLIDFDSSRRAFNVVLGQVTKRRTKQQQAAEGQPAAGGQAQLARGLRLLAQAQSESATSQLVDEARLLKLREQFNYCRLMYETINAELHDELPLAYEKKMRALSALLRCYFALEAHYHSRAAGLMSSALEAIDEVPLELADRQGPEPEPDRDDEASLEGAKLASEASADELGPYRRLRAQAGLVGVPPAASSATNLRCGGGSSSGMGSSRGDSSSGPSSLGQPDASSLSAGDSPDPGPAAASAEGVAGADSAAGAAAAGPGAEAGAPTAGWLAGRVEPAAGAAPQPTRPAQSEARMFELDIGHIESGLRSLKSVDRADEADDDPPPPPRAPDHDQRPQVQALVAATSSGAGDTLDSQHELCLYKVQTNYKYLAEDVDELCFEADEVIQVVEFDESHEPEDGWLMGVREANGQRGLFPANYTRPL